MPFSLPQVTQAQRARALELLAALKGHYPNAKCELEYSSPHELLVATILSAQATDAGVNKATPALFKRFPAPSDYANSTPQEIEPYIRTIGLFRNKAKAIHASMKDVVEVFHGEVPRTMAELLTLHGVARKTANVVLGNAFGINVGIPVDTHIQRLSVRLGLVKDGTSVQMIERRLMALFPRDQWCEAGHRLIFHGRYACKARCPASGGCHQHPICAQFGRSCECRKAR
ncbi:MAG: endonuclease III [Phycisphaeraceae bacterium]|nr:endonuclease III [Phycisphaeraceae bacterium]